jgi:uncharacterized PurR-regulated membrane protein YhhQ (DUF165 family)
MELDYVAIGAAAVAAFIVSGVWYALFGDRLSQLHPAYVDGGAPSASTVLVELVRNLVVATVIAGLISRLPVETWHGAIVLGLALWVGFPVVLLAGSVYHEKVPPQLAAIHSGDWLLKLLTIAVILTVWP